MVSARLFARATLGTALTQFFRRALISTNAILTSTTAMPTPLAQTWQGLFHARAIVATQEAGLYARIFWNVRFIFTTVRCMRSAPTPLGHLHAPVTRASRAMGIGATT